MEATYGYVGQTEGAARLVAGESECGTHFLIVLLLHLASPLLPLKTFKHPTADMDQTTTGLVVHICAKHAANHTVRLGNETAAGQSIPLPELNRSNVVIRVRSLS